MSRSSGPPLVVQPTRPSSTFSRGELTVNRSIILRVFLCLFALLTLLAIPSMPAQAQTLTVLYSFTNSPNSPNGDLPGALVRDKQGNLYGVTYVGGTSGVGTVFKVDTAGSETVLHSFALVGPEMPTAGLIMDKAGNLYGTTSFFGIEGCCGAVFELDTSGNFVVLHHFSGQPDGDTPSSALVMDKRGNLYGTTQYGGSSNLGTVFKLDSSGHETLLHSFTGSDGYWPEISDLFMDKEGNLYGTTFAGGSAGQGTVFKLDSAGNETVLHSFAWPDSAYPDGLVMDKKGNFYGTTFAGGSADVGTVFKLDTAGNETVLHTFTNSPDGAQPGGALAMDKMGNLYGTTRQGGSFGHGTVFEVDTSGKETVVHNFGDTPDGEFPSGGLIIDKKGNLYGATQFGGDFGYGTVFELVPLTATTTALASSLNPSIYGQAVTWRATVTSSGSIPLTGRVRFTWSGYTIGEGTLNSSGVATLTRSNLNADPYPLTAVYAGDTNNLGSRSALLNQVVLETTTSATLTSSPNPSTQGQAVTFTATITSLTVTPP